MAFLNTNPSSYATPLRMQQRTSRLVRETNLHQMAVGVRIWHFSLLVGLDEAAAQFVRSNQPYLRFASS